MKRLYMDRNAQTECVGYLIRDCELIWAGATVCSMPVSERERRREYETFEKEYDVRFIFDDDVPKVDFYAVPWVEVFARDSRGGFLAGLNGSVDAQSETPVCYISKERECFLAAESAEAFLKAPMGWQERLKPAADVNIFDSLEAAQSCLPFWKPEKEKEHEA